MSALAVVARLRIVIAAEVDFTLRTYAAEDLGRASHGSARRALGGSEEEVQKCGDTGGNEPFESRCCCSAARGLAPLEWN